MGPKGLKVIYVSYTPANVETRFAEWRARCRMS